MSQDNQLPSLGLYGLGIIGSRAADHLAEAGYPLRTWSRSKRDRPDFEGDAAAVAHTATILLLYLKDVPAVREIFEKVRPHLDGKTLINHATIDLTTTEFLATECAKLGCSFLNAPFTGSKVAAGKGELVYYAGGDPELIARLRPLLETTSCEIMEVDSPEAATVLKLTTNLISASTVQALAEGLKLNLAHGISAETFQKAIAPNACASVLASMKVPSMAAGDFEAHFSLSNMLKDARYVLDLAERSALATPGIATTATRMQELDDAGFGDNDFSVLFRQFDHSS